MLKKRIEVSQRDNGSQEVIENNRKKLIMHCEVPRTRKDLMFLLDMSSKKPFSGFISGRCWNQAT